MPGSAGRGCKRADPVKKGARGAEAIQRSALSTDAAGRVLFIYGAQNLNGSSANAMLKIIEEPPEGGAVPADGDERGHRAADDPQPVRGLYDCAVPAADCAARLKAERLPAKAAEELAFFV